MKARILLPLLGIGLLPFFQQGYAQVKVGDNPTVINANAVLEMESTNKGTLLPRVALTATTNASPLSAHVQGMFVYNTATSADVTPGIYYNDGTKWMQAKFATCQGFGARTVSGTQVHPGGGVYTKVQFTGEEWDQGNVFSPGAATSNFTVAEAGRYIITATVFTQADPTTANNRALSLFKNGATLVQGDNTQVGVNQGYGLKVSYIANLAAGDVIDLRLYVLNSTVTQIGSASFSAVKADCGGDSGSGGGVTVNDEPWRNVSDSSGATATSTNIFYNRGLVGIGTAAPGYMLHVAGPIKAVSGVYTGQLYNGNASIDGAEMFSGPNDAYIAVQRDAGANLFLTKTSAVAGDRFQVFGINSAVVGSITRVAGGISYNQTSDMRLKEHITGSRYGLTDLMKIRVVDYNYKTDKATPSTGFLAQELYPIYPFAVTRGGENAQTDPWLIDYSKLTPLLVKAAQEQQKQIEELKAQNAALQLQVAELGQLKAEVAEIKAMLPQAVSHRGKAKAVATK